MKIIFFNIWHGKVWDGLKNFILEQSSGTDIFCFLEVDPELQKKLEKILPGFTPFFSKGIRTAYLNRIYEGRSTFVRKGIKIKESKTFSIFKTAPNDAGGFQFLSLDIDGKPLFIGNTHGKARPGTKRDTPIRIKQSEKIIEIFKDKKGPKIIGGDFNLEPDTKSVKMFEESGYKNLIKEFGIKNTRNRLSWEQFNNSQYFADFVFTSPEIKIKSFKVPHNEISDHLPQILEFSLD